MHQLAILPDARNRTHSALRASWNFVDALSILNIVFEFANVDAAVGVDFLTVPVDNSVLEIADDLRPVIESVTSIAGHGRLGILPDIAVAELIIGDDLTMEVAALELTLENALHVLEGPISVHLTVFELAFVVLPWLRSPLVKALAIEFSVLEFSLVKITARHGQMALAMENIREKLALVDILLTFEVPDHFSLALHLRVTEITNVVAAVRPLELSIPLHLAVNELTTVQVLFSDLAHLIWIILALLEAMLLPFLDRFALDLAVLIKYSVELDSAMVADFHSLALDAVLPPPPVILRPIAHLFEFALAVEHAILKSTRVRAAIRENFVADSARLIMIKVAGINCSVREEQLAGAILATVLPVAFVPRAIGPFDDRVPVHFTALPVARVAPALVLTDENSVALLITLAVLAFV